MSLGAGVVFAVLVILVIVGIVMMMRAENEVSKCASRKVARHLPTKAEVESLKAEKAKRTESFYRPAERPIKSGC